MRLATLINLFSLHLSNKLRLLRGKPAIPYKWLIQLTNDCNSKCLNCEIWKINKNDPSLRERETTIPQYQSFFAKNGHQLKWLALSGGEITLFREMDTFVELIKIHSPNLKIITFTTNGLLPKKTLEIAKAFRGVASDLFVVISLDGDKENHDETRGIKGNYQLAQKTFELLQEHQIPCYFGMTLTHNNALWAEKAVTHIKSVSLVHSDGIYQKEVALHDDVISTSLKEMLKNYRIRKLSELGEYFYLKNALLFLNSKRTKLPIKCDVLNSSLHISPQGEILPCMYLGPIGNIKEEKSLEEMLDLEKTKNVREIIKNELCAKCWMNCYAPHSILEHPIKTIINAIS